MRVPAASFAAISLASSRPWRPAHWLPSWFADLCQERARAVFATQGFLMSSMEKKLGVQVFRERLVLDGAVYTITVYAKLHKFRAIWFCGACSERSKIAAEDETVQAAVDSCKLGLASHHTKMHARH
jgi:hypothetical protein